MQSGYTVLPASAQSESQSESGLAESQPEDMMAAEVVGEASPVTSEVDLLPDTTPRVMVKFNEKLGAAQQFKITIQAFSADYAAPVDLSSVFKAGPMKTLQALQFTADKDVQHVVYKFAWELKAPPAGEHRHVVWKVETASGSGVAQGAFTVSGATAVETDSY